MHRRASALVYVILVVFSVTSIVLVTARVASAGESSFAESLSEAQFKGMVDGAVAEAKADAYKRNLAAGSRTSAFSSRTANVTVTRPLGLARSFALEVTANIGGRSYRASKVIGDRAAPNPAYYGIWATNNYSDSSLPTTLQGSAYFSGDCTLVGTWTVTEDLLVRGTSAPSAGTSVAGHFLTGVRTQSMPAPAAANYTATGTATANSLGDIAFGPEVGGYYPVMTKTSGNLTLSGGTISGSGTLFVTGNLTISGNYSYAAPGSRILIIVGGRVTIGAGVTQLVGTCYVTGRIDINTSALNVARGNLCTGAGLNRSAAALSLTQDRAFLDSPEESRKHRLPGFVP